MKRYPLAGAKFSDTGKQSGCEARHKLSLVQKSSSKSKIMKYITTILFLWLFTFTVKAQEYQYVPFPGSNAVWSELSWSSESPAVYNKYALFDEDTVINNITYRKLFHTANNATITRENSVCIGMLKEDNFRRIWFKY